jgi:Protein of unknown function (DUF1566)
MTVQVKMLRGLLLPLFGLCLSSPVWAQSSASLLVTTDTNCDWKLDGVSQGRLNVDDAKVVKTTAGEHLLQATSADGQLKWQSTVTADSSAQRLVKIPLSDLVPTWTDPATGLMWERTGNGSDVDWKQASSYCANLRLSGVSGWRLPTIEELTAIYDQTQNVSGWHIKGGMHPTGPTWSNSVGNDSAVGAWAFQFDFFLGKQGTYDPRESRNGRALCVRRSGA